jgi:Glycosyltransferase family 10 (fucosyltransferase) C-term
MRVASASLMRVVGILLIVQLASVHWLYIHLNGLDESGDAVGPLHRKIDTISSASIKEPQQKPYSQNSGRNRKRQDPEHRIGAAIAPSSIGREVYTSVADAIIRPAIMSNLSTSDIYFDPVHQKIPIWNSWHQTRYVCGKPVPPNGNLVVDTLECPQDVQFGRVFLKEPSLSGEDKETMVVRFRDDKKKHRLHNVTCDIPCAVWPAGNPTTMNPATVDGTPFRFVAYSMEGSGIYKSLEVKPLDHYQHHYYATTSFRSDVPLSYYSEEMWNIGSPSVDYETSIKGASFLARNCNSVSNRENLVKELMKAASAVSPSFRIESLSSCLRNALPPKGVDLTNKTEVMGSYLFHFAFENQVTEDYISEKLWGALASGTVPVYLGAPNVLEHVPPRSIILARDFDSARELIAYLASLAYNQTLYSTYHEWRKMPLPPAFHEKYDFTRAHSHCRLCRFSYALKYGWEWDHKSQQVLPLRYPRQTCVDEQARMIRPIEETWNTPEIDNGDVDKDGRVDCGINRKRHLPIHGTHWIRTVWDHDGITDIEIRVNTDAVNHSHQNDSLLRLRMPLNTSRLINSRPRQKVYWVQDDYTRAIIVFNETMILSERLEARGTVKIPIDRPLRIRLILEAIDAFHEGGDRKESYFGSLMIDEFLHPLKFGSPLNPIEPSMI